MQTALLCIDEVNARKDSGGVSPARKCIIRSGLAKDIDGARRISQLSKELQAILYIHPGQFNGLLAEAKICDVETQSDSDFSI